MSAQTDKVAAEQRRRTDYDELHEVVVSMGDVIDRLDRLAKKRNCTRAELFYGPKAVRP